jgi:hypothetical protein
MCPLNGDLNAFCSTNLTKSIELSGTGKSIRKVSMHELVRAGGISIPNGCVVTRIAVMLLTLVVGAG